MHQSLRANSVHSALDAGLRLSFLAFIAFIAFAFKLTVLMAFIARRMPFFIGGASSTAFFIAFAMMKGEREIEGYGHELKNQLEPQQKTRSCPVYRKIPRPNQSLEPCIYHPRT